MRFTKNFYIFGSLLLLIALFFMVIFAQRFLEGSQQASKGYTFPVPPTALPTTAAPPTSAPVLTQTPSSGGKAFYVSPSGSDKNDGSRTHPFATIQHAADLTTPGTTVHVLPGTYTDRVTVENDGTSSARITYISDVKWGAKIRTTSSTDPWRTYADYINIIGFDVSSTNSRDGIANFGSFISTIGNHVHDIPGGGCDSIGGSGIDDEKYTAHDDDIIGNVVNNIRETYPKLCEYVHGIYHSTARGHILNNISYDNAGCGINLWHAATETIVMNNLVFGNKEHGISVGTNTDNTDGVMGDHFVVANNISIDNALLGIRERMGVGPHNQYLDNVVYGNGDAPFGDEQYNWPSSARSKDIDTITSNVQFVRFAPDGSGDYHLQAGSPAISAGTPTDAPTTDIDGKPRPQGKDIDIGPYQDS